MPEIDREVGNWFTSTHPQSGFKSRLTVARAGADGRRYTLLNRELKIRERDGHASVYPLHRGVKRRGSAAVRLSA